MEIVRAELTDVEILAELNRRLNEDQQHPPWMNMNQLTQRMKTWLENEYVCYLAKENGSIIACIKMKENILPV